MIISKYEPLWKELTAMPVAENSFQAIDRAFLVLETIAHTGAMSLAELHKALNINKPALFRIVQALCNNG